MENPIDVNAITVVTVTYGARWQLLRLSLHAVRSQGVGRVVVVDNGATDAIAPLAYAEFASFVDVVTLSRNTGSAGGFRAGLQRALELDAEYILLLDDDNLVQPGCLRALAEAYRHYVRTVPRDALAMLAYRSDLQADTAVGVPANGMEGDPAAFFGFNLRDLPFKLFRRTRWGREWIARRLPASFVPVAVAPYSGMFFHRAVPEVHGLPDDRFLLYADDTDFSFRLVRAGGKIVLVTEAKLADLELSWNVRKRFSNTFDALLLGDGDFRAYYSTRNNAYFERWSRGGKGFLRAVNRMVYLCALLLRAAMKGRRQRFALLLTAIRDGEAGRLGEHPHFPL